jgi:hypothetical protein
VRGYEAQRGVSLQHLVLGGTDRSDLEEMVHQHDVLEASVVCGAGHGGQRRAELFRVAGPGEIRNLKSEFHAITSCASLPYPEEAPVSGRRLG